MMYVLNFSHPLTEQQKTQIQTLTGEAIIEIKTIPVQIKQEEQMEGQLLAIVDAIQFTPEEWQTLSLVINPPGYAPAAFVLLAILHALTGHFPTFLRLRPRHESITTFEVAEIINLQAIREKARTRRYPSQ